MFALGAVVMCLFACTARAGPARYTVTVTELSTVWQSFTNTVYASSVEYVTLSTFAYPETTYTTTTTMPPQGTLTEYNSILVPVTTTVTETVTKTTSDINGVGLTSTYSLAPSTVTAAHGTSVVYVTVPSSTVVGCATEAAPTGVTTYVTRYA